MQQTLNHISFGKSICFWLLFVLVGAGFASAAEFPSLWGKRVDSDPKKDYFLTEQNGPWLVMAYVFTGDQANTYAKKLCLELRKEFKLDAYVYNKKIKHEERLVSRGLDASGAGLRYMKYQTDPTVNAYVVFVGNYSSVEDPEGDATMKKLRKIKPKCMEYHGDFAAENPLGQTMDSYNSKHGYGPLGRAFLTKNPLLPAETAAMAGGLDPKVVNYNRNVRFCLLDCPGKYSVQIGTYRGFRTINQNEIQKIKNTGEVSVDPESSLTLAEADQRAEKLTQFLRNKGIEAYCFRDHYASIVTIGSFDEISYVNPQTGKQEAIPEIQKIFQEYGAFQDPSKVGRESVRLKMMAGVPLDAAPMIINVPKAPRATARIPGFGSF